MAPWRGKLLYTLEHHYYKIGVNIFIILSLLQFAFAEYIGLGDTSNSGMRAVLIGAIVNNFIFLLDLILHFVALGFFRTYKRMNGAVIETILQSVGVIAFFFAVSGGFADQIRALGIYDIIFLFRTLRLLYLFGEIQQVKIL